MVMQLGKLIVAASLVTLFSVSPAMAEGNPVDQLMQITKEYAELPPQDVIEAPADARASLADRIQQNLDNVMESVNYNELSNLEDSQQQAFVSLSKRISKFITGLREGTLNKPMQGDKA